MRTVKSLSASAIMIVAGWTVLGQTPATLSPAERTSETSQKAIAENPKNLDAYNRLALGLARRARETSNPLYYNKADEAIAQSLELSPNNFEALKMRVWVLLGKHEFQQARDQARLLNKQIPDDLQV